MERVSLLPPTTWVRERWNRGSRCSITKVVESGGGVCSELLPRFNFQVPVKSGFAIGPSKQDDGVGPSSGAAMRLSELTPPNRVISRLLPAEYHGPLPAIRDP